MTVARIQFVLSGWRGGPGINTWHVQTPGVSPMTPERAQAAVDALRGFYTALQNRLPGDVSAVPLGEVPVFATHSGALQTVYSVTPGSIISGGGVASSTSRATQMKIQIRTDRIVSNRRIRGGIFFGPLDDSAITSGGEISSATRTAVQNAGSTLLAIPDVVFGVWKRPVSGAGGEFGEATSITAWELPAVLRRRRD